ncbi:DoxX family protein [Pseudomonas lutea]|uniref:DoxX family protein n=1 Tax=Pseudomonas lutea TaxID=243924 RepID=A0ABR9A9X2_9PSED|nr:DoxX family protein [Pseudomonas lutea]MBD8122923.1 DoxX family protein [Pseudomonas lutea]
MINNRTAPYAALILRLALGIMFLAHGLTKLFVFTPAGTADYLASAGFPGWFAYPILTFEIVVGVGLVLGVLVRELAMLSVIELFVASTAHFKNGWGFSNPNGGWEYPIFLCIAALVLVLLGSGPYAISKRRLT